MNLLEKIQNLLAALTGNVFTVTVAFVEKPVVVEDSAATAAIVPANKRNSHQPMSDEQAKAKLVEVLNNPKYRFRSLDRLTKAIGGTPGADQYTTEEFLSQIGARPSRRNPKLWGLTSRIGRRQYA